MRKRTDGFTIVELLIVVVVVAILATVTVVSYNGIQAQAYNSTVQSDLHNLAQKFEIYKASNDRYPLLDDLASVGVTVSKQSYDTSTNAFLYCFRTDGSQYAFIARSKSKTNYTVSSLNPAVATYTLSSFPTGGYATHCPNVLGTNQQNVWFHSIDSTPNWKSFVQ